MENTKLLKELESYRNEYRKEDDKWVEKYTENSSLTQKDFTYGSTPYDTAIKLINHVKKTPERFVVVGTSIGWMNFYWNEVYPNIPSLGIDIHQGRINFGNSLIEKYELENIELQVGDLYEFEFKDTDLLWMSNLCFDWDATQKIMADIIEKNPDIAIISYRPIHHSPSRKWVTGYHYPVSWMEKQPFHIYEKIDKKQ